MSGTKKAILTVAGILSAVLVIAQVVMALLILRDRGNPGLRTAHQHSGYLMAVVALLYITFSLIAIASVPTRPRP